MQKPSRQQAKFKVLLAERARFMKHNLTETEQMLWRRLAGKRLGVAFKRQAVIDRFVVDFVAPAVRVIVEVDGGYHSQRVAADTRRDRVLQRMGYRVVRVEAELVRHNPEEALSRIRQGLKCAWEP